jgi:holo-[acyl-carrier protein] synthase
MTSPTLRVGIDLLAVSEVAESVRRFGDHYVHRIFTPHEIECCQVECSSSEVSPNYSYESLAARFAAKEAVVKVLQPVGARPAWRDIEVHRVANGSTEIRLFGLAAAMADQAGIEEMAVSLTHERLAAAAIVVGFCKSGAGETALCGAGARGKE